MRSFFPVSIVLFAALTLAAGAARAQNEPNSAPPQTPSQTPFFRDVPPNRSASAAAQKLEVTGSLENRSADTATTAQTGTLSVTTKSVVHTAKVTVPSAKTSAKTTSAATKVVRRGAKVAPASKPFRLLQDESSWTFEQLLKRARFDLNGDGKPETIRLETFKEHAKNGRWYPNGVFRLWVNGQNLWGTGRESIIGFGLADIQKDDRFKEVVYSCGPSDTLFAEIFRFNGHKLHHVADLRNVRFYGDGRVDQRVDVDGFWQATQHYRLRRGHLQLMPFDLYPVGQKATLTQPLALYRTRHSKKSFKVLPKGHHVIVVKGTMDGNYLVQARDAWGWVKSGQINYATMQGLRFAG